MSPLLSIDPTMGYDQINKIRLEALTLRSIACSKPLQSWLDQFIAECATKLPSHKCWLEDNEHIIIQSSEEWKSIVLMIETEPGEIGTEGEEEQMEYAFCKRYELKDQPEPASYNQSPPGGLHGNYPYLYKVRISQETRYELLKLHLRRITNNNNKEQRKKKDDDT